MSISSAEKIRAGGISTIGAGIGVNNFIRSRFYSTNLGLGSYSEFFISFLSIYSTVKALLLLVSIGYLLILSAKMEKISYNGFGGTALS